MNRRQIPHTRLEAIAGADNPYSLITVFGRETWPLRLASSVRDEMLTGGGGPTLP